MTATPYHGAVILPERLRNKIFRIIIIIIILGDC